MSVLGRLVKNPDRVRPILQQADSVGQHPGLVHIIGQGDKATMPKISKTGMYENRAGNRFYYEEGAPVTDEQRRELNYVGPRDRRERERALPAAPENRMDVPPQTPENGQGAPENRSPDSYDAMTVPQLRDVATERNIQVPSDAKKADIIAALQGAGGAQAGGGN